MSGFSFTVKEFNNGSGHVALLLCVKDAGDDWATLGPTGHGETGAEASEALGKSAMVWAEALKRYIDSGQLATGVIKVTARADALNADSKIAAADRLAIAAERLAKCYEDDMPDSEFGSAGGRQIECPCGCCGEELVSALAEYPEAGLEAHTAECAGGIAFGGEMCNCSATYDGKRRLLEAGLVDAVDSMKPRASMAKTPDELRQSARYVVESAVVLADHLRCTVSGVGNER